VGQFWTPIDSLNGIDPQAWLCTVLQRIAGCWRDNDLDALMPWNCQRSCTATRGRLLANNVLIPEFCG
jgi:hypothetical protein